MKRLRLDREVVALLLADGVLRTTGAGSAVSFNCTVVGHSLCAPNGCSGSPTCRGETPP